MTRGILRPIGRKVTYTYTDENFRIIGQARSSIHLSVLESVYINIFLRERVTEWLRRRTRKPKVSERPRFESRAGQFGSCP